ncbi:MAG: RNA polymerase sigma factor [Vicinamibacteria bacterium]
MSDTVLVSGFLEGRAESHAQVDRWIREVVEHPRLGLAEAAEDVAQETRRRLLLAFRTASYRGEASLRTYVWRVAEHAAIDHLRARRRRPPTSALEDLPEASEPATRPEVEERLGREERRALFARVLAELGEDCRRLFGLIVFDELPYAEIARRLGTTEGAVKLRALRCRERASEILARVTSHGARRR